MILALSSNKALCPESFLPCICLIFLIKCFFDCLLWIYLHPHSIATWVLSHVWLFMTPWTVAHQTPLSMGFPRQEYWSRMPLPLPGNLPDPGISSASLLSLELVGRFHERHLGRLHWTEVSCVKVKVTQSYLTLCDPHGLYSPRNSPGHNAGVGSLSLLQGIFPTQGLSPGPPLCRQILQQLVW